MKRLFTWGILCWLSLPLQAQLQLSDMSATAAGNGYLTLFNPAMNATSINSGCYSLAVYFRQGRQEGVFVLGLPDRPIPAGGRFLLAASDRIAYTGSGPVERFDWRSNSGLTVRKYLSRGDGTYAVSNSSFEDVLVSSQAAGSLLLLYNRGDLSGYHWGGQGRTAFEEPTISLPPLHITGPCGIVRINFGDIVTDVLTSEGNYAAFQSPQSPAAPRQFNANRTRTEAELIWMSPPTASGRNPEVDHRNGEEPWTTAGYVGALAPDNRSNETIDYFYGTNSQQTGNSQFRLRQVNVSNGTSFGPVRDIKGLDGGHTVRVYPNPSPDGRITVLFERADGLRDLQLIDMSGRVVRQWVSVNNNQHQLDNLDRGNYILRIINRKWGTVSTEKIVVSRQ